MTKTLDKKIEELSGSAAAWFEGYADGLDCARAWVKEEIKPLDYPKDSIQPYAKGWNECLQAVNRVLGMEDIVLYVHLKNAPTR
jgi:hypothetical protein